MLPFSAGIENAEFHCSKAESFLPNFMRHLRGTECVAVVDPPRSGLRKSYSIHLTFAVLHTRVLQQVAIPKRSYVQQ